VRHAIWAPARCPSTIQLVQLSLQGLITCYISASLLEMAIVPWGGGNEQGRGQQCNRKAHSRLPVGHQSVEAWQSHSAVV
jgi:hypothetical protein